MVYCAHIVTAANCAANFCTSSCLVLESAYSSKTEWSLGHICMCTGKEVLERSWYYSVRIKVYGKSERKQTHLD